MKNTVISLVFILFSPVAFAYGDWVSMKNIKSTDIDFKFKKCYYEEDNKFSFKEGFAISIIINTYENSFCPSMIKYNPIIGKWKKGW